MPAARSAVFQTASWSFGQAASSSAIDDPGMKQRVWQDAAETWIQSAPEQAVEAFIAPGAPAMSEGLVKSLAQQLVRTQPELADKFAAGLPPNLATAARSAMAEK